MSNRFLRGMGQPILVAGALFLLLAYYWWRQPLILSPFGLRTLSNQGMALALVTLGQLAVIIVGGIDLSLGATVALVGCIAAQGFAAGYGAVIVLPAALLASVAVGLCNGLFVVRMRLPPIIVTLATSYIIGGLALYVMPSPGGTAPGWLHMLLTASSGWLPHALVLMAVVLLLVWLPIARGRIGAELYAIGDHEESALLTGLPVGRAKIFAYGYAGLLSGLSGVFLTAQTSSGDPGIGTSYTLGSIAAAVLGGASLAGGRGGAFGGLAAAWLISILISVLFAAGISTFLLGVFQGGILMLVLLSGRMKLLKRGSWMRLVEGAE